MRRRSLRKKYASTDLFRELAAGAAQASARRPGTVTDGGTVALEAPVGLAVGGTHGRGAPRARPATLGEIGHRQLRAVLGKVIVAGWQEVCERCGRRAREPDAARP